MKLLHLIRSVDPVGGGLAEGLRQITPHLSALGVNSTVASLDSPDSPCLQDQPYAAIGLGPVVGNYGYRRNLPAQIRALALRHDAVTIEGLWQYHALATWRALRDTNVPYFVYPHGMLDPWFKRSYPLKHLKKWAYWPWADYRVLHDAEAVLFTTEQERILARQSFRLYHAKEIVVGYGTSAPPVDDRRQIAVFLNRFPHLRDKRIFLFLSRIHPKKGVDLLLDSFAAVASTDTNLQLVIAGPDQVGLQASLQRRAAELGIADRVTWPGMLSGDLKWGAFRCAELFCLPSHQENFGVVVAEALACGVPLAIAEPVNISAEVAAGNAGLVHSDTLDGTTAALRKWLTLSAEQKTLMGKRGETLFRERFDFASVAKNLLPVLNAAVNNHTTGSP
jgi:glycosyltransferase involved in cell wall biosynthesis